MLLAYPLAITLAIAFADALDVASISTQRSITPGQHVPVTWSRQQGDPTSFTFGRSVINSDKVDLIFATVSAEAGDTGGVVTAVIPDARQFVFVAGRESEGPFFVASQTLSVQNVDGPLITNVPFVHE
ncbi:hypothetical protein V5O48_007309 [Marasmius crinis-equi]|uniref:Uncharacterized protein n=1 Tax=Marasmius crinis-equi TaxID=585013 RepID=A0ABR3FH26_9AGAR